MRTADDADYADAGPFENGTRYSRTLCFSAAPAGHGVIHAKSADQYRRNAHDAPGPKTGDAVRRPPKPLGRDGSQGRNPRANPPGNASEWKFT